MNRAVWKYDIPIDQAANTLGYFASIPTGAQFLHCAIQYRENTITTWFEVNPDAPEETRCFRVFGTGHTIDQRGLYYRGTTLHFNGTLVLHLYEDAS